MRYFRKKLQITAVILLPMVASANAVTNPLGYSSISALINAVLQSLMVIGAPIAVLLIVFAGFKFVMAQGKEKDLNDAKNNLLYTIIGIVIFFGAAVIMSVLTNTVGQITGKTGLQASGSAAPAFSTSGVTASQLSASSLPLTVQQEPICPNCRCSIAVPNSSIT